VPAGTYHFVLDCIVIAGVDVTFDLMHRRGADNTVITTWSQHFNPLATGFDAQAYEIDMTGAKVDFQAGDKLVFRFTAMNTIQSDAWIPNGDGTLSKGRIPNITLPK
jgi:hypothetical protein